MKIRKLSLAMLFVSPVCLALSTDQNRESTDMTHVISDYRIALASIPLDYALLEKKQLSGLVLQRYKLYSQTWSPQGVVTPERWENEVDIFIPESAREIHALMVINNGSNHNTAGTPVAPTNFTEDQLGRIAIATQTVVISISNVPNQVLSYQGLNSPLAEDASVAYSWKLFLGDMQKYQNASLHIPMATSISQAFRLTKKELQAQKLSRFMITGASKRGWAAWLTALADPDVAAVIPIAFDLLDTKKTLEHMYQSYGNNWPIAFYPYYTQGIDQHIATQEFASLMKMEDPLTYLNTDMGKRLGIDKYIINASGDDFYVPDNSHFYYEKLPGQKSLRVVPNTSHNGVLSVAEQSLTTFVNRFQNQKKLPKINEKLQVVDGNGKVLMVQFSETPMSILQWTAENPIARDFRYACNIKYSSTPVSSVLLGETLRIPLTTPDSGWQASYLEATFSDGYVATTQVYISPDDKYPETAPPSKGAACQTLAGRGLSTVSMKR